MSFGELPVPGHKVENIPGFTVVARATADEKVLQLYRFAGGHQDPAGLDHYSARYHAPDMGRRFNSPHASGQEQNPCLYAEGDPVNKMDPTGLVFEYLGATGRFAKSKDLLVFLGLWLTRFRHRRAGADQALHQLLVGALGQCHRFDAEFERAAYRMRDALTDGRALGDALVVPPPVDVRFSDTQVIDGGGERPVVGGSVQQEPPYKGGSGLNVTPRTSVSSALIASTQECRQVLQRRPHAQESRFRLLWTTPTAAEWVGAGHGLQVFTLHVGEAQCLGPVVRCASGGGPGV